MGEYPAASESDPWEPTPPWHWRRWLLGYTWRQWHWGNTMMGFHDGEYRYSDDVQRAQHYLRETFE